MTSRPYEATEHDFTVDTTRPVLDRACRAAGLNNRHVSLLRHHSNAVYLVGQPPRQVVVKIGRPRPDRARDLHDARAMVELTGWLSRHGVPATGLLDTIAQPLHINGHVVTLWHYLPQHRPMSTAAMAAPLRALHEAPLPPIARPRLDPHAAITRSIAASRILSTRQQTLLLDRLDRLTPVAAALRTTPPRLIHTDPQHRNTLWRAHDQAVLCDLDDVTVGPVEWDLVTIEIHCRRFGHSDYDAFCRAYGRDVRDWSGYRALRDLRELRMVTTNARKSAPNTHQAAEVLRRIERLDGAADERWRIL
ncbi:aminoglycoside phosphotransferase family protein [Saccharothrix obliqua]|uniref:aminoglycoside phosphotransferase family protein n=1 Tax=Saccharothrix obliqua TaxID=2861747 RepID=UPI001C5F476B|nr:aminoglycoside phosphotransferase family protein [Saccharothrix obliqua]MBW4718689.1 aminoglycoside phosphotransferase family protein [Saccharothrix obliqua]